jgi:hypothetical protein
MRSFSYPDEREIANAVFQDSGAAGGKPDSFCVQWISEEVRIDHNADGSGIGTKRIYVIATPGVKAGIAGLHLGIRSAKKLTPRH